MPELTRVLKLGSMLDKNVFLGINNRDLTTFEVSLENTRTVMESDAGKEVIERGLLMTGESGIFTYDDVAFVQKVESPLLIPAWPQSSCDLLFSDGLVAFPCHFIMPPPRPTLHRQMTLPNADA